MARDSRIGVTGGGASARARSNSAAAAKAVAPKPSKRKVVPPVRVVRPGETIPIDSHPKAIKTIVRDTPQRSASGISGTAGNSVNPVYKMQQGRNSR